MNSEDIARVAHETNRAYCEVNGDNSQLPWDLAPSWQKESAIAGVEATIRNPGMSHAASHNGWLAVKREAGWTYGPVKDAEKKEHPCFMPYEDLPEAQKRKDALFLSVVRALL